MRYARKTKTHDAIFSMIGLFPLPARFLPLKWLWENTAIIRWPQRKVTALQVVKNTVTLHYITSHRVQKYAKRIGLNQASFTWLN